MEIAPDDRSRELLARVLAEELPADPEMLAADTANTLHALERRRLERRMRELTAMSAEAERRADESMRRQLAMEIMDVQRKLRTL